MASVPDFAVATFHMNLQSDQALEADFWRELAEIEAESIGWMPLEPGYYLHAADPQAAEVTVVGVPQLGTALLLVMA